LLLAAQQQFIQLDYNYAQWLEFIYTVSCTGNSARHLHFCLMPVATGTHAISGCYYSTSTFSAAHRSSERWGSTQLAGPARLKHAAANKHAGQQHFSSLLAPAATAYCSLWQMPHAHTLQLFCMLQPLSRCSSAIQQAAASHVPRCITKHTTAWYGRAVTVFAL
jgi:hypothetical protein